MMKGLISSLLLDILIHLATRKLDLFTALSSACRAIWTETLHLSRAHPAIYSPLERHGYHRSKGLDQYCDSWARW